VQIRTTARRLLHASSTLGILSTHLSHSAVSSTGSTMNDATFGYDLAMMKNLMTGLPRRFARIEDGRGDGRRMQHVRAHRCRCQRVGTHGHPRHRAAHVGGRRGVILPADIVSEMFGGALVVSMRRNAAPVAGSAHGTFLIA